MATPAFVYAFDNLGPERFVQLCGLLLGARYKGFLLTSPGPDGGVDAEDCPILGELVMESQAVLQETLLQPAKKVIFQFKHKVVARVGEANARTQLLSLYRPTTTRKSEVLGSEIVKRNPNTYVLVTNVEINSGFRSLFAELCSNENSNIQDYQVIGLDELEVWVTQERQLRALYFPTIFSAARFNLSLKLALEYIHGQEDYSWVHNTKPDIPILCLTVMNVGEATSYLSDVKFKIYQECQVVYLPDYRIPRSRDLETNPKTTPIEPGRNSEFRYSLRELQYYAGKEGKFFLDSVIVCDQIDNLYSLEVPNEIREVLLGMTASVDSDRCEGV
jgi:hypothetical protein